MADDLQQPEQLSVQQFAARLRTKYPGSYDDLPDDVLTERVLEHHPQYRDMVAPSSPPQAAAAPQDSQPQPKPTLQQRIGSMVPDSAVGPLTWIQKNVNEPLDRLAAKGAEIGRRMTEPIIPPSTPDEAKAQGVEVYQSPPVAKGIERGIFETAGGAVADPRNWPFLASSAARPLLQRFISGGFAAQMGKGALDTAKTLYANWDNLAPDKRAELITQGGLSAAMAAGAATHAVGGESRLTSEQPAPVPQSTPALPWLRKNRSTESAPEIPSPPEGTGAPVTAAAPEVQGLANVPAPLKDQQGPHAAAPASAIPGQYGAGSVVKTPSADIPARYKLVEAGNLIPSHDAETFQPHMMYPPNVQERAYHGSKEAQARVIEQAQNYDPRYTVNTNPDAVNGPPIVTPDGIVLGGNSRTMSTQRLYSRGQADGYRQYLSSNAQQFGLDPTAIDSMQHPILVREVPSPPDLDTARRVASELNKSMTGALGVSERAVSAGKSITPDSLKAISGMLDQIGPDSSIRDLLRDRGADVLKILTKDGAITDRERPQFIDTSTGGLSEEGKTFAERALLGTVLDDATLMERSPKSILNKLDGSLADIAAIAPRHDEYNLVPMIREAIQEHADVAAHGSNVETHLAQAGMFGPERNAAVDAIVRKLAQKPKAVREAFRNFSRDASADQPGQGFLAMGEQPSAATAFNRAFGTRFTDAQYEQLVMQSLRREGKKGKIYAEEMQPQARPGNAGIRQSSAQGSAGSRAQGTGRIAAGAEGRAQVSPPELAFANPPGPGAKNIGTREVPETPLQQLTMWLPHVTTARMSPLERMKAVEGAITGKVGYIHNTFQRTMLKAETSILGLWDAYRRPPEWTEFNDAVGKWQGALQYSAYELQKFAHELKRVMPDKTRREAITNWIQAGGDEALLRERAQTAKAPLKAAYKASLTLTPEERILANNVRGYLDAQLEEAQRAGMLETGVANYISQIWNKDAAEAQQVRAINSASELRTRPFWTKERIFHSYFEGEDAGFIPKDKDAGFLLSAYHQSFAKAVADRGLIKQLLKAKASDGRPLVQVSGVGRTLLESELSPETRAHLIIPHAKGETATDYLTINSPSLRRWKWVGKDDAGKPIYLEGDLVTHPEIYRQLYNLMSDSALRKSAVGRAALKLSGEFKSTLLSLSLFHQTQIGVHALEHTVNPFHLPKLDLDNATHRALVDHGLQVADFSAMEAFSEGLHGSGLINKIPGIGPKMQQYQSYLFRDYIPRVKMSMAEHALTRNMERYAGKLSQDQILAETAKQANAAFGELNYKMMARNKTFQDVMRLIVLAPDFLEARGRFVGQALKPFGREQQRALVLGAAVMYVGARIVNQLVNGDPDWDPEHAFSIRVGKRLYTLRTVQGDLLHLVTDPRSFAAHRLNPMTTRPILEGLTGRDEFGRPRDLKGQITDIAKGIAPIPLQGLMRPGDVDLKESLAKGVGATASRYRSRAARTAHELYVQGATFGETTRTPAEQKLMQKHRSAIDAGKFDPNAVRTDLKAGRLTERDAKLLLSESQSPQLVRDFKRLPLEKALQVWEVANDDERKQLRPALQKKAESLKNRVPAERAKLQQQLRGALSQTAAPQPAIPQFFRKMLSQAPTTATAAKP
jgi:hypothetical protein